MGQAGRFIQAPPDPKPIGFGYAPAKTSTCDVVIVLARVPRTYTAG